MNTEMDIVERQQQKRLFQQLAQQKQLQRASLIPGFLPVESGISGGDLSIEDEAVTTVQSPSTLGIKQIDLIEADDRSTRRSSVRRASSSKGGLNPSLVRKSIFTEDERVANARAQQRTSVGAGYGTKRYSATSTSASGTAADGLTETGFHDIYAGGNDDRQPQTAQLLTPIDFFNFIKHQKMQLIALLYVAVGLIWYMMYQKLSFLDAIYFIIVTTTTVGYGDITPSDDAGKLFTTFYIVIGVTMVLPQISNTISVAMKQSLDIFYRFECLSGYPKVNVYLSVLAVMIFSGLFVGVVYMTVHQELSFIQSLYWSVVTAFTVGYGDINTSARKESYRVFAIFYILIVLCVISGAIGIYEEIEAEHKRLKKEESIKNKQLTLEMLLSMDKGGEEGVDRLEFLISSESIFISTSSLKFNLMSIYTYIFIRSTL